MKNKGQKCYESENRSLKCYEVKYEGQKCYESENRGQKCFEVKYRGQKWYKSKNGVKNVMSQKKGDLNVMR